MRKNYFSYLFPTKDTHALKRALSPLRSVHMDDAAKARTRALLQEYMEMQPIRTTGPAHEAARSSLFSSIVIITRRGYLVPITAVVLTFGLTAGTAFAAEGALPGDTLYSMKVHITEEARGILASTPKAKADWEIERTSRRLEEASTLAIEGNLTNERRVEIENNLARHVFATEQKVKALAGNNENADADMVGAELYAVLKAHGDILASVLPVVDDQGDTSNSRSLISDITAHLDSAAAMSTHEDTDSVIEVTTAKRKGIALNEISSLRSYIEREKAGGSAPELIARADTQLQKAETTYTDAVKDLDAGATTTALRKFSNARNTALDTKASLTAQTRLLNLSLRLTQATRGTQDGESVAATMAPQVKTAALKPATTARSSDLQLNSKESSERTSRTPVIHSVIGVLLHGSDDASKGEDREQNTRSTVENKSSSGGTDENRDNEDSSDHDLRSIHLGL